MWHGLMGWVLMMLAVATVAYLIARIWTESSQPAEPDDYADTPARLRPRPRAGAGAIAIAEPEEDDEPDTRSHRRS